ncbi:MAG: hypothetical protein IT324_19000 [Anaerolineae bacterium]|nr:hypothetical protein [Anaerolineae bacterium]
MFIRGSARYSVISWLGRQSALFSAYYRLHPKYRKLLVKPDYEVVIEGFPRCANTFAVLAFEQAQQRPMRIAHHLHAPAQVELGVRYGLPILVLIRNPSDAAASLITRHPEISPGQALQQYVTFYEYVKSYEDDIVLADFQSVTSNFARVIDALNQRFTTRFNAYINKQDEDAAVFAKIDVLSLTEGESRQQIAKPSEEKKPNLSSARDRIEREPLLRQARIVFEQRSKKCF